MSKEREEMLNDEDKAQFLRTIQERKPFLSDKAQRALHGFIRMLVFGDGMKWCGGHNFMVREDYEPIAEYVTRVLRPEIKSEHVTLMLEFSEQLDREDHDFMLSVATLNLILEHNTAGRTKTTLRDEDAPLWMDVLVYIWHEFTPERTQIERQFFDDCDKSAKELIAMNPEFTYNEAWTVALNTNGNAERLTSDDMTRRRHTRSRELLADLREAKVPLPEELAL